MGGMDPLPYKELKDAIDGIHAYDAGAVSSGIHDERLRARIISTVDGMGEVEARTVLSRIVRDLCLSDEAIADGYGYEDALGLCRWIDEGFGR